MYFLKLEKKQCFFLGNSLVARGVVQCLALKLGHFQCYCSQCMLAASVIAFISVNFCLCQASCMHHLTSSLCHPFQAAAHTVSFDWFLSGLERILNLEFCLIKLLIFYQKLSWNIRSRLNSSTFWVFEPVFRYVWSKSSFFVQKASVLIKYI